LISTRVAVAWPGRSATKRSITISRAPSASSGYSQRSVKRLTTPSSSLPVSRAADRSSTSPAGRPCTRRSCFGCFLREKRKRRRFSLEIQRLRPCHRGDEDLAIANATRTRRADDPVGNLLGALITYPNTNLHLGQKRHAIFAADIPIEIPLLPAIALGLAHDTGYHVHFGDRPQDRLGTEGFDHDSELFH